MADNVWLDTMSTEPKKLKREAAKRRKQYEETSVVKSAVEECLESGW